MHNAIAAADATPSIMSKRNATDAIIGLFQTMFYFVQFERIEFQTHYQPLRRLQIDRPREIRPAFADEVNALVSRVGAVVFHEQ
jgi:hypothetical protein